MLGIQSRIFDLVLFEVGGGRLYHVENGHPVFILSSRAERSEVEESLTVVVCSAALVRLIRDFSTALEMTGGLCGGGFFQTLRHIRRLQGVNHLFEIAFHDAVEIIERQTDAVIGDAVLRKIVGADFFFAAA